MHSILTLALIFGFSAFAQQNNVLSLKPEIQKGDLNKPQGLWPFVGVGLGVMDHNSQVRSGGVPSHVKILGSYYFESAPWVADIGIGFHNQFLTQKGSGSDNIQSLYSELAARYQFSNRWQLGAIWNTLVDNPDRYRSNTNNLASFMGVQVMKEFTWSRDYLVRAGGRAMTDVGISGETIDTVMAELEVSFGPNSAKKDVIRVEQSRPEPIAPHLARRAVQTFNIDPDNVNFESDSTKLVSGSQQYLSHLARALSANRQLFDRVEVIGHADQRGTENYNEGLSKRRARAIADTLVASGISPSQLVLEGRGEKDLLSNSMSPAALLRNRRVELRFEGVKNPEALKNVIESVRR